MEPSSVIEPPQRYAFLLLPDFSLSAVAGCLDVLTAANKRAAIPTHPLYRWRLYHSGETVAGWGGVGFDNVVDFACDDGADLIFVCAGGDVRHAITPRLLHWLQSAARRGARLGAIGSGAWVLAAAGLVEHCRLAVHGDYRAALSEQFPELDLTESLFEIDRRRLSCAGAGAAVDMMLALAAEDQGAAFATTLGHYLMHGPVRQPHDSPVLSISARLGVHHPRLEAIIARMESELGTSLRPSLLAQQAGMSTRQLERLFRRYLASTPKRYHLELRLLRAQRLLLQTNIPVIHVALACGFESAAHFSKSYRVFFGHAPSQERGLPVPARAAQSPFMIPPAKRNQPDHAPEDFEGISVDTRKSPTKSSCGQSSGV